MAKIPLFKGSKKTILPFRTGWAYNRLVKISNIARTELAKVERINEERYETICHKQTEIDNLTEEKGRLARSHEAAITKRVDIIRLLENNAETAVNELARGSKQIAHLTAQLEKVNKPVSKKRAKKKK